MSLFSFGPFTREHTSCLNGDKLIVAGFFRGSRVFFAGRGFLTKIAGFFAGIFSRVFSPGS